MHSLLSCFFICFLNIFEKSNFGKLKNMKRTATLFTGLFAVSGLFAQGTDTLLFEDFSSDLSYILTDAPAGSNTEWVNFDEDGEADANSRPQEWFASLGFADQDSTNPVMASSSWLSDATKTNRNWLMTPPIVIINDLANISWKSAPYQLPKYIDGYTVLVSTTNNFESSFTDTLAHFAEYLSGDETTPFVFTEGTMHTLYEPNLTDTTRHRGILQEWTASLAQYSGETIYIAFLHSCQDDNLISIDDIFVTGTKVVGVAENGNDFSAKVFPNPAQDYLQLSYTLSKTSSIGYSIFNSEGKLVDSGNKGAQIAGQQSLMLDVKNLASGSYSVVVKSSQGTFTTKFIKN